jgi:hypothetical protein
MTTKNVKAVEMTRQTRDKHYEQLKGATTEERIAFYREKARAFHKKYGLPEPKLATEKGDQMEAHNRP